MENKNEQAMTIRFDTITHYQLKAKAAQLGCSMQKLVADATMNWLDENPPIYPLTDWRQLYDERQKHLKETRKRAKVQGAKIEADIQRADIEEAVKQS